jgi:hypothetical protein
MRFNDSIKKLVVSTFAIVMLLGFGLVAEANAQGNYNQDRYQRDNDRGNGRDRDGRNRRYSRQEIYRIAQQLGYQDGLRRGLEARRYNRRSEYDRADEYRNGLRGFRSEYGDRPAFQQGYREGFRRGYVESYRRASSNNRWPR